ncbi:Ndl1p Ecym_2730 [Eremothecium cymbalariae DBVPG|uniref:NUDE domain-containing protein n=1 Tax=Eremothecium cymbalariae (strain CBS 270.75 / DBVPG 7215 / KCTC 17166 / NRRL Y-17582) TaxID=931890 RepID=G8JPG5_ERECY|nr:Hypothetical protein Ecym_2730 [Eremothecium cymbalariae DBVPG\
MDKIKSLDQAWDVIKTLQQQLADLDTTGKEYEFQLEQTIEVLRRELEEVQHHATETITKLEIQIDELQEQNRQWESKYISEREQNGHLIQDKLILQCELEQMKEEVARIRIDEQYDVDSNSDSDKSSSPTTPDSMSPSGLGPPLASPIAFDRPMASSNVGSSISVKNRLPIENIIGLPSQHHSSCSPQIRVMFKGASLMLQSMIGDDSKMIVPSLSQATVMATTSSQTPKR